MLIQKASRLEAPVSLAMTCSISAFRLIYCSSKSHTGKAGARRGASSAPIKANKAREANAVQNFIREPFCASRTGAACIVLQTFELRRVRSVLVFGQRLRTEGNRCDWIL